MKTIKVGFWRQTKNSKEDLPFPIPTAAAYNNNFIRCLKNLEDKAKRVAYRGWSTCRLCGCHNGTASFIYEEYEWPSGLAHYIVDHNIQLPEDFIDLVLAFEN